MLAEKSLNYLPQLIIGLDSLNDDANYVHIDDIKDNVTYYCPCCKGEIKARANKREVNYKVQPHFYHISDGCNEETFVHYICKNWLFESGCKFIIDGTLYEVLTIETERLLHTAFGDYQPDIIVTTTTGETLYFEIKVSNKKTTNYIPKWDALGNKVVEIDVRYFINQKHCNNIPEFKLIYSDGQCFIKEYAHSNYENIIAERKKEWKRQDKLNYKIQWERLDWFWIELQEYAKDKRTADDVMETFTVLDYLDKLWIYYTVKNKACVDFRSLFKENINNVFFDELKSLEQDNIKISMVHTSPKIYTVHCRSEFTYLDYTLFEEETVKIKVTKGDIIPLDSIKDVKIALSHLSMRIADDNIILNQIQDYGKLSYVNSIVPYSYWGAKNKPFQELDFKITFEDYLHSQYIKEHIGTELIAVSNLSKELIQHCYARIRETQHSLIDNDFIAEALKNNKKYQSLLLDLQELCAESKYLKLRISGDMDKITLLNGNSCVYSYIYNKDDLFGGFESKIKDLFVKHIEEQKAQIKETIKYIDIVNSCSNHLWNINEFNGSRITLRLLDPCNECKVIDTKQVWLENISSIENNILQAMHSLLEYAENYKGIRFMEVN